jgi:hypothetical protein
VTQIGESMPEAKATREATKRRRINLGDAMDVRYWCERFGCTQSDLRAAVKLLGGEPSKVEQYLLREAANIRREVRRSSRVRG